MDAGSRLEPGAPDRGTLALVIAAGAIAVAPHTLQLEPWVPGVFAVGAFWRFGMEWRGWRRPGKLVRSLSVLLVAAMTWQQHHTFLGRDPGLTLLIALLGLKFLELHRVRDFRLNLFLYYLVTLGSFLYEQTLLLGLYALGSVLLTTVALVRIAQPKGLALRANLRLSATMLAQAVPLMLVVYVLFPRLPGALWSLPADAGTGRTGLSDTLRPGNIHQLSESGEIAFRASFDGKIPAMRDLYWRAIVLWETDGHAWSRGRAPADARAGFTPIGEPVTYEIVLEPTQRTWAMALDLPRTVPERAAARSGFTFEFRQPVHERRRYTLTSYPRYRTGALAAGERAAALQLPPVLSPRVRALAGEWVRSQPAPAGVVNAALGFFHRENFVYTLAPPPLGDDPVDEFLFSARRGYCEHYASAFVTLMRAAGVPARPVLGYQGGEFNVAGNYLIVRQSDAHAWAEVWLEPGGWTRVDPTAAVAPERIELGMDALRRMAARGTAFGTLPVADVLQDIEIGWGERAWIYTRLYWDLANISWYRWVTDYGYERQEKLFERLGLGGMSGAALVLVALSCIGTLLGAYALWRRHERPRVDAVQAQYLRLCRKLARVGLVRAPHEAAGDFARRCATRRPDLADAVDGLTREYERLRYGSGTTPRDTALLRRRVAALRLRRRAA